MARDVVALPALGRRALLRAESIDAAARSFEVVWTTGATVRRRRLFDDDIDEQLVVGEGSVRLERLNSGAPFLDTHNAWSLAGMLGVVEEGSARIEGGRGHARVRLSERDEVEPVWRDIRAGIIRNVSVGYRVHRFEIETRDGEVELWRAVDWEPMELSAVPMGADPDAHVRSAEGRGDALTPCRLVRRGATAAAAATLKGETMDTHDEQADGAGGVETREADTAAPAATGAAEAPAAPDGERGAEGAAEGQRSEAGSWPRSAGEAEEAARRAVADERERVATINRLCRRHGLDGAFADDLVARGVGLEAARGAILDRLAEQDPMQGRAHEPALAAARNSGASEAAYRDALSTALLHRHDPSGHALDDDARAFRGLTLLEMARHAVERHGRSTRGMSKMELASAAFETRATGHHSTSDFPSVLANVANKTLRAAYERTPRSFARWARRATITDFKPVQRTQLGGAPDLEKVLESGEFQYGTIGEAKEVYALATYGRIVGITRQTLINDDLDAFTRIPAAFGASAADLESDIVYQILMQNPAMADGTALFHADHGNLGTAAVISETALAEAYRLFGQHTGLEKRLISILPRFILVPPGARSVEARKQVTATTPSNTTDVNSFAGRLEVVEEPRLIPGSGEDPWFLAADASRIDTVEYAYLDGQEGVFTETRMGFEVDGMEIKARHDFAAKAIDWRGLYRNAGAST